MLPNIFLIFSPHWMVLYRNTDLIKNIQILLLNSHPRSFYEHLQIIIGSPLGT